jgi:lauroyl/myristoyl acyltransferase
VRSSREIDIEAALERAGRPIGAPRMPRADLALRLKTSPLLRRLVPTRLVVDMAASRGEALWSSAPEQRARALAAAEAIVGGTARAGEVEAIARERLIAQEIERMILWQPWPVPMLERGTLERLQGAISVGRGVLLSLCHFGPIYYTSGIGLRLGRSMYVVSGAWMLAPPSPDYWGRRLARRLQGLRHYGARAVPAPGSFDVLAELLRRGEPILINFDVPGRHETRFLGKPVMLTAGTAKLAFTADALVVPVRIRSQRHRHWLDAGEVLDPRELSGVRELHEALAAVHERWILEQPALLEDPRRAGSWEDATADRWPLSRRD